MGGSGECGGRGGEPPHHGRSETSLSPLSLPPSPQGALSAERAGQEAELARLREECRERIEVGQVMRSLACTVSLLTFVGFPILLSSLSDKFEPCVLVVHVSYSSHKTQKKNSSSGFHGNCIPQILPVVWNSLPRSHHFCASFLSSPSSGA